MPKGLVDLVGVNDNRDDDKKVEKNYFQIWLIDIIINILWFKSS